MNQIIKYSFLKDLAYVFAMYEPYNLASLYIYKYNLGEITKFKNNY